MSSVGFLFSNFSVPISHGFAAMSVLLSQHWEVHMELRGEPISGGIFTLDLPSGYHRLKPQVNFSLHLFENDRYRHKTRTIALYIQDCFSMLDEESAKEEARRSKQEREIGYSNADVVVKLQGWDPTHAKSVAQASLSALKQLIISDKRLPGRNNKQKQPNCGVS